MTYLRRRRQGLIFAGLVLLTVAAAQAGHPSPIGWLNALFNKAKTEQKPSAIESVFPGVVRGVVVERITEIDRRGRLQYGFVIQNPALTADKDARTSDALYVLVGESKTIPSRRGTYKPRIGDDIILRGKTSVFHGRLVLKNPELAKRVRRNVDVNYEIPPFEARPPQDQAKANAYWKARHGMRCRLPAGCIVQGAYYPGSAEGHSYISVIRPDHSLLKREGLYQRRVFRDAHPFDDHSRLVFDNGNGFLMTLGDAVLKAKNDRTTSQLPRVRTFDQLLEGLEGVVLKWDDRYIIHIADAPHIKHGAPPDGNVVPVIIAAGPGKLSVGNYNVENFYDTRDDPFDGRDYYARPPDPLKSNVVSRLHNYVPATEAAYRRKTDGLARQIVNDLRSPDLLFVQETEDQDICLVQNGRLLAGSTDNRDGRLDSLQDLALAISKAGGPEYEIAGDRHASDVRGITCAFMYREDRLALAGASGHPLFDGIPDIPYDGVVLTYNMGPANPRAINASHAGLGQVFTRAPMLACFKAVPGANQAMPEDACLYAINNHFRSIPNMHVAMRVQQASLNAAIYNAIRRHDKHAWIIVGGDLNTFPRPDEPVPDVPADQLGALYDAGLLNLYDTMLKDRAESAYTYIYRGQAQTLDHLFVSPSLADHLLQVSCLHINSDFPPDPKIADRRCSDHDPILAVFDLSVSAK